MNTRSFLSFAMTLLLAGAADARDDAHAHSPGMQHATERQSPATVPLQAGQSAFAALQEITAIVENRPDVDWNKVDLEALRLHLIDMDNVTLRARITTVAIPDGARFTVTGEGEVADSIRRMAGAHVAATDGADGWRLSYQPLADGAVITARAERERDAARARGLGFIGLLARGMHHQQHHLMIALGESPHH